MKIKTSAAAMILFITIFGGIALTSSLGLWKTENNKEPVRYNDKEFKGEYDPSDIRGSYTFGEISKLFEIPIEDLSKAFDIESGYESFKCKELEEIYSTAAVEGKEIGTNSVRIFVALYKSLPITLNDSTYFPDSAVKILKERGSLKEDQIKYLERNTVIK